MRRMDVADFDFVLPPEFIAQRPAPRGTARLLTLDRGTGARAHRFVADLPSLLRAGDVLVLNDTKVIPARIFGTDEKGRRTEFLLVSKIPEIPGISVLSSKGEKSLALPREAGEAGEAREEVLLRRGMGGRGARE